MKRVDFDPESVDWSSFFQQQINQSGRGSDYFSGTLYQRGGFGLGSIFTGLLRYLLPIGKSIGKEGLAAAGRIASDLASGDNFKSSLKKQAGKSAQTLLSQAGDKIASQTGSGKRRRKRRIGKKRFTFRNNLAALRKIRKGVIRKGRRRRVPKKRDALGIISNDV